MLGRFLFATAVLFFYWSAEKSPVFANSFDRESKSLDPPTSISIELTGKELKSYTKNVLAALKMKSEQMKGTSVIVPKSVKRNFLGKVRIKYESGLDILYNARFRINGDAFDHLNSFPKLNITSLHVELLDQNSLGFRRFKLFMPETRLWDREIFATSLFTNVGLLAPFTSHVNVSIFSGSTKSQVKMLFQEDLKKEFLERNNLREAPIIEFDENTLWQGLSFALHQWGWDTPNSFKLDNTGFGKKGDASFSQSARAIGAIQQMFTYKKFNREIEKFEFLHAALGAYHGLRFHNRKFYFEPITSKIRPIYYDGNPKLNPMSWTRSILPENRFFSFATREKEFLDNLLSPTSKQKIKTMYLNRIIAGDKEVRFETLWSKLEESVEKLHSVSSGSLDKPKFQSEPHPGFSHYKYLPSYKLKYEGNSYKICYERPFYGDSSVVNVKKDKLGILELNVGECLMPSSKHLPEIIAGKSGITFNRKSIIDYAYDENFLLNRKHEAFLNKHSIIGHFFLPIENNLDNRFTSLKIQPLKRYGTNRVEVDIKEDIIFQLNGEDFGNVVFNISPRSPIVPKIVLLGQGSIKSLKANFSKTSQFKVSRTDQYGLTGCITFKDFKGTIGEVLIGGAPCEDALNFIKSEAEIGLIKINKSASDAVDADYSKLLFKEIHIENSGNDCLDFSGGNYKVLSVSLINCQDKAISVGENSKAIFDTVNVAKSGYGIVAKDSSSVQVIEQTSISDTNICFAAYNKKPEFFGGTIYEPSNMKNNCNRPNFVDVQSKVERINP